MENSGVEDTVKEIIKFFNQVGYATPDAKHFFDSIRERYQIPSLISIVDEELPKIIKHDPSFFQKYCINLPERLDVALFDLYYSSHGIGAVKSVTHSAKVWLRHLRFFLIDKPNDEELNCAISEFKKIINGQYFNHLKQQSI